jgi:peptidoglycan LD-endopeptidase LytH
VKRLALIIAVLTLAGVIAAPFLRPAFERVRLLYQLANASPPAYLRNPIAGVPPRAVVNTWAATRPGGRRHEGIDIFAPRDTPVLSTTRGLVTRVGTNSLGGQVVWILGPGLESHYYAHLDRFADIHRGDIVNAGDVIGYVGRTGNARGTPFHLHYGIYRHGRAENPFPRLTGAPNTAFLSP